MTSLGPTLAYSPHPAPVPLGSENDAERAPPLRPGPPATQRLPLLPKHFCPLRSTKPAEQPHFNAYTRDRGPTRSTSSGCGAKPDVGSDAVRGYSARRADIGSIREARRAGM